MIDRMLDKIIDTGTWMSQDMRRVQIMLTIFSVIGVAAFYLFYQDTVTTLKAFEAKQSVVEYHPYLFYACGVFSIITLQVLLLLAQKGWKISYTIIFFLTAFLGLIGGYFTTHYVEAEALNAQYYEKCTPTYSGRYSAILFARSQADCDAYEREKAKWQTTDQS